MGYDALHVREIGLKDAGDKDIFETAFKDKRIIVTADTDFGYLLSIWNESKPSLIIFRKGAERNPITQVELLKNNLPKLQEAIERGSIVIIEASRIRIRELPI
jgi:predicted nuclease of predicted toxin-antitoxin system